MMHILKCQACGRYTLKETCDCGGSAATVKPAKYSPDDKYAELRRTVKRPALEEKGWL